MKNKLACLLTLLAFAGVALAADALQLAGPVSGLVYDPPSKSLRVIAGVPGAAYLGASLADGLEIAAVSPDGRLVFAIKDGALQLLRVTESDAAWESIEQDASGVQQITWSADSSAAVVAGVDIRLWRHLDTTPERLALSNVDGAAWSSFAVEAGAEAALAAGPSGVYLLTGSEARLVAALESAGAIALSSNTLYAADRAQKRVVAIRDWRGGADVRQLGETIDDPVALAIAQDQRSLLVASGASRLLLQLDPDSGAITGKWDLDFAPTRVERLSSGIYSLNSRTADTPSLQVLTTGAQPAVLFIPAGGSGAQEE